MCFSTTASFVTGAALLATGAVTIKKAKTKRETAFAAVPFLFGVQQIAEGMVWLSMGSSMQFLSQFATYIYVFFAYILWPVFIPLSVGLLETDPYRKKIIYTFLVTGVMVSLYLLFFILQNTIVSHVVNESIVYSMPTQHGILPVLLYLVATCGSCLFSSHRMIVGIGVLGTVSLAISYYFYTVSFVSVWCFFASVLSIFVYLYFSKK